MIREDDIICRLTQFAARIAGMDEQQRRLLEDEIRQEFGGERAYVRRVNWNNVDERDEEILAAIRAGEKYRHIASRMCISVGTVCLVAERVKPVQSLAKN